LVERAPNTVILDNEDAEEPDDWTLEEIEKIVKKHFGDDGKLRNKALLLLNDIVHWRKQAAAPAPVLADSTDVQG